MGILQPAYSYLGLRTGNETEVLAEFNNRVSAGPFQFGKGTEIAEDEVGVKEMWRREMKEGNIFSYFNRHAINQAYLDIKHYKQEHGIPLQTNGLGGE